MILAIGGLILDVDWCVNVRLVLNMHSKENLPDQKGSSHLACFGDPKGANREFRPR